MLDRLKTFLRNLPGPDTRADMRDDDDPRVAAVALMFHVVDADGVRQSAERERLEEVIRQTYAIGGAELKRLLAAGEAADREAIDLYAFTRVLKRHLDGDAKADFIRILWEISYADGERHELEENIVWRVAELIGVESTQRIALRQAVEAEADTGKD